MLNKIESQHHNGGWTLKEKTFLAVFVAAMIIAICFLVKYSPIITVNGGTGWDGENYYNTFRLILGKRLETGQMDVNFSRTLPIIFLAIITKYYDLGIDKPAFIALFQIFNICVLSLNVLLLLGVAKSLRLTAAWAATLLIAVLFSWGNLTAVAFYPASIDPITNTLAILVWLFWLNKKSELVLLCAFLASLTNPLVAIFALLLLCFPRGKGRVLSDTETPTIAEKRFALLLSVWVAFSVAFMVREIWHYFGSQRIHFNWPMTEEFTPLAIFFTMIFLILSLFYPLSWFLRLISFQRFIDPFLKSEKRIITIVVILAVLISSTLIMKYLTAFYMVLFYGDIRNPIFYLFGWIYSSGVVPLRPQIAHIVFSGPVIIFTYLYWRRITGLAASFGIGAILILIIAAFLVTVNSETRQINFCIIVLSSLTVRVLAEKFPYSKIIPFIVSVCCLILARPWWAFLAKLPAENEWTELLDINHGQEFFRFIGPWMTPSSLLEQCVWIFPIAVVALAIAFYPVRPSLQTNK